MVMRQRVTDMSGKPASEEERRVRTCSVGRTPRLCEGARPITIHVHVLAITTPIATEVSNKRWERCEINEPSAASEGPWEH